MCSVSPLFILEYNGEALYVIPLICVTVQGLDH